jgi:hypothetical protein
MIFTSRLRQQWKIRTLQNEQLAGEGQRVAGAPQGGDITVRYGGGVVSTCPIPVLGVTYGTFSTLSNHIHKRRYLGHCLWHP